MHSADSSSLNHRRVDLRNSVRRTLLSTPFLSFTSESGRCNNARARVAPAGGQLMAVFTASLGVPVVRVFHQVSTNSFYEY